MTFKDAQQGSGHLSLSSAAYRASGHGLQEASAPVGKQPHVTVNVTSTRPAGKGHHAANSARRRQWPSANVLAVCSIALLLLSFISWQTTSLLVGRGKAGTLGDRVPGSGTLGLRQALSRLDGKSQGQHFTFQEYEDEEGADPWGTPPAPASRFLHYEQEVELFRWAGETYDPDRKARVVIMIPSCCRVVPLDPPLEQLCHQHVLAQCRMDAPDACYKQAVAGGHCRGMQQPSVAGISYFAALRDSVPILAELGWRDIEVVTSEANHASAQGSSQSGTSCDKQKPGQAVPSLLHADIIFADISLISGLVDLYPSAVFVAVDTSNPATLSPAAPLHDRILAILKGQTLKPMVLNNRFSFHGFSHLAFIPGVRNEKGYMQQRDEPLSDSALQRIKPLLSHAHRYRHPLDCGGSVQNLRYQGLFAQNYSHYRPPLLKDRSVDLAYIIYELDDEVDAPVKGVLYSHWRELLDKMKAMRQTMPLVNIEVIHLGSFADHGALVTALQDIKILISPYGPAEWSAVDFDAMLNGCVLLKPRAGAFTAFPDIFQAEDVVEVSTEWRDLDRQVDGLLRALPETQRKAWRSARDLAELSDPLRYADYLDRLLLSLTEEMQQTSRNGLRSQSGEETLDRQGLPEPSTVELNEITKEEAMEIVKRSARHMSQHDGRYPKFA